MNNLVYDFFKWPDIGFKVSFVGERNTWFFYARHCMCHTKETAKSELEIATDTVANATNTFSLVTKNSGLVATLAIRLLYDLDLN